MHRSAPYLARFRDLFGLRFGKKAPTQSSAEEAGTAQEIDEESENQIQADALRARGVLKNLRPYEPPSNTEEKIVSIVRNAISNPNKVDGRSWLDVSFSENGGNDFKFRIFAETEESLGKRIPASYLHELKTVADLVDFYRSPVKNVTNYVDMSRSKDRLPKNLHILDEAKRFHPIADGETAFPGLSHYVTDLRERQFYKGFRAKKEWHHYKDKHFDYNAPPPDCPWDKKKAERFDIMSSLKKPNYPV